AGISKSVAIKFDLFDNAGEGDNSTGIFTDGEPPFEPSTNLTRFGIDLHSGDVFEVHMDYQGTTLSVTITDTVTSATFFQPYAVDIPAVLGGSNAHVGFTGGTGGAEAVQVIKNWTFSPGLAKCLTLLGTAMAGNLIAR